MYIVGTAGHVDHGKTALIKALTGTDTDRLPEEKRRGLTIELGFASLLLHDGSRVGIIDVPGHERFIRNMAAGAWALQCALLVVAADDGWMKQTEDHARVLQGMGTPTILVVISKIDLVDSSRVQYVTEEVLRKCRNIFSYSPAVAAVSALTGEGLDDCRRLITEHILKKDTRNFPTCMFIDRVFTLQGLGAVATGSLVGGSLHVGDEITLLPERKRGRIRSLQSHSTKLDEVTPCSRTAVHLQGLKAEHIHRGSCLCAAESDFFVETKMLCVLWYIDNGNPDEAPLRNHQQVEVSYGTRHSICTVHFIPNMTGEDARVIFARLVFSDKAVCFWNQPFICMRPGGSDVLCRGRFIAPGTVRDNAVRHLADLVYSRNGIPEEVQSPAHVSLVMYGYAQMKGSDHDQYAFPDIRYDWYQDWLVEKKRSANLKENIIKLAGQLGGITQEELKSKLKLPHGLVAVIIEHMQETGELQVNNHMLTASSRKKDLTPPAKQLLQKLHASGMQGMEVKHLTRDDRGILRILVREGYVAVLDGSILYPRETYASLISSILKGKQIGDHFSIADAKKHVPLSRKYMLPLLNTMEEDGYVVRVGDMRKVCKLENS